MQPCRSRHKAPQGHRSTAKHPPCSQNENLHKFVLSIFLKKWPSDSLHGSYLGQGADVNVGQKEPLLSIKKEEREGWSDGRRIARVSPPVKDHAGCSPQPTPEDRGDQITHRGGEWR